MAQFGINGSPVHLLVHQSAGHLAESESGRPAEGDRGTCLVALARLPASDEGLVLLTNDGLWAARVAPEVRRLTRVYHVLISRPVDEALAARLVRGVTDQGDFLAAHAARPIRETTDDRWLEWELREMGRMSPRRLLQAFGIAVLRVRRVSLGPLQLGDLPPGQHRLLTLEEMAEIEGGRETVPMI